jgi:hypothetical protein
MASPFAACFRKRLTPEVGTGPVRVVGSSFLATKRVAVEEMKKAADYGTTDNRLRTTDHGTTDNKIMSGKAGSRKQKAERERRGKAEALRR